MKLKRKEIVVEMDTNLSNKALKLLIKSRLSETLDVGEHIEVLQVYANEIKQKEK